VVAVHGYPDDHTVWDGVVALLAERFHVVTYDVRGAGASEAPEGREGYRIPQLVEDLYAVIDTATPGEAIHLVAHDWGSIQSWGAVTDPRSTDRLASFTSISGPSLDMAADWLRRGTAHPVAALRQLADSYYIFGFQAPVLPERIVRSGVLDRLVTHSSRKGTPWRRHRPVEHRPTRDAINGLELYRANFLTRMARPIPGRAHVPVQVLAPTDDAHVTSRLQREAPRPFVDDLHTREIVGNHWVVAQKPHVVARCITEFIDHVGGGPLPRSLRPGRHQDAARPLGLGHADQFSERLVLITGAGSGIGRASALEFARQGADILVADIDDTAAKETVHLVEEAGRHAWALHLDVASERSWQELTEGVLAAHGVPDIVVNNAGIGMGGGFLDTSVEDWERVLGVNLWGVIHGSRLFGRLLAERGEGGHIVNVASAAAFSPSRILAAYGTTKAAVLSLTESLRAELAYDRVGVTAICPGFVNTNIARTTRFVGTSDEEQARLSAHQQASYQRRNFTPERLAKHLVAAVRRNTPVAAISAEAKFFQLGHRYAPALTRRVARLDLNEL
jgi:NAD(P)-dependent dehydrogenase (short-subunit alcohol dehydrogenase family)/pimeloyl-ACP methyl ester carboxylesterase